MKRLAVAFVCVLSLASSVARAQERQTGRGTAGAEVVIGHAGFVDDATIHHLVVGGAARWYVSPRISIGPEIVYMRGPGHDRDLVATGNITVDFLSPTPDRVFTPFFVAGAGWFHHRDRIGANAFSSSEGAFTVGAGARARVSNRWYVGADARIGWELHTRITGVVGWRLP